MLELIGGLPGNVVGIAVSGRLTKQDCEDLLIPAMQKSLSRHEKIRLYYELNSRFPGAAWDELDLGLERAAGCDRHRYRLGAAHGKGPSLSDPERNPGVRDNRSR